MTTVATKTAWIALLLLSALWALNHAVGVFVFADDEVGPLLFVLLAAIGVLATGVLLGPYRQRRRWAWWSVNVEVIALLAISFIVQPRVGAWYLGAGLLMVAAQLVTLREFTRATATGAVG